MSKTLRRALFALSLGAGVLFGSSYWLQADEKPVRRPAPPVAPREGPPPPAGYPSGGGFELIPGGGVVGEPAREVSDHYLPESKPDKSISPVKVTNDIAKTDFAVKPKPLSPAVKKGLEYLVRNQRPDGGWNQGGGWRQNIGGGRIEGPNVEDPSDVGNTAFALLALIRAGNTPTEGEYREAVQRGLEFILKHVEKADSDSLYVTDIRGTQLQSKIGRYVDTFMANLVLAELRGKAGRLEPRVVAALEKTMTKIVRHQGPDGSFAGNVGWASTLSIGIANKSVARARERGAQVDEVVLKRIVAQAKTAADNAGRAPAGGFGLAGADGARPARPAAGPAAPSDAGIALYSASQGAGNLQDVVNSLRLDAAKAREVLQNKNAPPAARLAAERKLAELDRLERQNAAVQADLTRNARDQRFLAGFGNNGGEEFLSFLNISETLVLKGGKEWEEWDARMTKGLEAAQDRDGSWQGHHCITGRTFCTAAALLVLMADRTPFPVEVIAAEREKRSLSPSQNQVPKSDK
ncbi:prenyltransferase/squalene oxidase repeat-containing protein [Thermogemmata fonticola]|uniref:Squalene cyclase C-terminal domain-containing protein n=1 Tax=Thermogemmata fonticola TaxID=2755323 RepID=A0A7V8VEK7_9BACT|nr:prenyltransferase/squalene oxidase repeat-containing protein [Thermogemmata fonticola]MBA2226604.1 hypothetical protein [Thermogemmata fonticola]